MEQGGRLSCNPCVTRATWSTPDGLAGIARAGRGIYTNAMNHKRRRPKARRAGCLLCKPNKLGRGMEKKLQHAGFGKLRAEAASDAALKERSGYVLDLPAGLGNPYKR